MLTENKTYSRRTFLAGTSAFVIGATLKAHGAGVPGAATEPIIDIHQHTHYHGWTDQQMMTHQKNMGITKTILLPAGRSVNTASTHNGSSNGLEALAGTNEACYKFAKEHPKEYLFGACEVPDLPDTVQVIEKYLKLGAIIIGELKFGVECDSTEMQKIYQLAQAYEVPVIMHWQYKTYNYGFERFYKMLEKYPKVNFIGHAQTWWANIDKNHGDQSVLYPSGKVTAGGITARYLSDYSNMYGDLSAGSGLNALKRDEDHGRLFLEKFQDKLLFGSDCADHTGLANADCSGAQDIAEVRKLSPTKKIERKLLYENSKKLFHL